MKRYESYKDSGVEWIGEIPSHWDVSRMKNHGIVQIGLSYSPEDVSDDNVGTIVLRSSNIQDGKVCMKDLVYVSSEIPSQLRVRDGDILICSRNGSRNLIGKNCLLTRNEEGMTWGVFMTVYRSEHPSYFCWVLNSQVFESQSGMFLTSTINQLTVSTLEGMVIPITPNRDEQEQIVSFLDEKTSQIDDLIKKKEQKIELLKEYRTSLINRVITQGLNPDVPMKDSGIEWIGEIPSHWEVKRLKHISESINGYSFKSEEFDLDNEIPVIRIGDVGDEIDFTTCVKVNSNYLVDKSEFIVVRGDILVGLTGGTIGKSGRYRYDSPSLLNQRVGLLRNRDSLLNGLLYYLVKSELFMTYIRFYCYGGGQDNISMNDINNMSFPYPPLTEQEQIVSYLDQKTGEIDSTIDSEKKKIDLLKEYRQSLISSVITGKIKVVD
jgi:type I restriction enzyme S subunit